ncbi:hypothetical protein OHC33_000371 [Knufia fluminis]|uniref:Uncharacterized protein n=1 Tax=Knufia fluminis TaxID=191047 RepID=A0AAN8F7S5_9EURO|nr:hypothetical protein OHC33_000371 [Knufia fluminis]
MSNLPRRSPRFQQQSQNTQSAVQSIPSFSSFSSQSSSTISTSHPSPTNDSLNLAGQPQQYPLQLQSQFLSPAQNFNAPLPSPSANETNPFGGSQFQYNTQMMGGQSQNQNNTASYQGNNTQSSFGGQQSQQQHHHNSFSQPQRPNFPPASVNGVPPGLPVDFLAEAAKRAQMACLMRDLDDVSL